jgi:hypothetical protein
MNQIFSIQYGFPLLATVVYFLCLLLHGLGKLKFSQGLFLFITAGYIGLVRLFDYQYLWSNPDVDQWIVCARSMVDNPGFWIKQYAIYDFTRLMTIVPIALIYWVFGSVGYLEVTVLFLISVIIFFVLQTKILVLFFEQSVVFLSVGLLVIFIVMSNHHNMRAFNSELPVVLLLSFAIFLWFKEIKTIWNIFLIGWLLSMVPFAKEQALYIALSAFVFIAIDLLFNRQRKLFFFMIIGSLAGGFLWMLVLLSFVGMDPIVAVVSSISEYGKMGLRQQELGIIDKIQIFSQVVWMNKEMLVLFPIVLMGLFVGLIQLRKEDFQRSMYFFFATTLIVACYVIYLPHNRFTHYHILLWPMVPYFIVVFITYAKERLRQYTYYLLPVLMFPFVLDVAYSRMRAWYPEEKEVEKIKKWQQDSYVKSLEHHQVSGSKMMVWGWDNRALVLYDIKRASGFLYPQYAFGKYSGTERVRDKYLHFMETVQPTFVLELVGNGRYFFNNLEQFGISENFTVLQSLLSQRYRLLESGSNFKLYKKI